MGFERFLLVAEKPLKCIGSGHARMACSGNQTVQSPSSVREGKAVRMAESKTLRDGLRIGKEVPGT